MDCHKFYNFVLRFCCFPGLQGKNLRELPSRCRLLPDGLSSLRGEVAEDVEVVLVVAVAEAVVEVEVCYIN